MRPTTTTNISRTSSQYHGVADRTRDTTEQRLPATVLCTLPTTDARTTLYYQLLLREQRGVGRQDRVAVTSESVYRSNGTLQASAIRFRVSVALGLAPAEAPCGLGLGTN